MYSKYECNCNVLCIVRCRGAQAAIIVYDITNTESFARAKQWVKELQRQASPGIIIALSGNKVDLAAKRTVDYDVRCAFLCCVTRLTRCTIALLL